MSLQRLGLIAVFLGFLLIFAGVAALAVSGIQQGSTSVGGVIFIGPFPIVFGAGPGYQYLLPVSLIIAILILVLSFLMYRSSRAKQKEAV
ncbi:MAG: DUF131 domain-containing protein [Conexivisphaerales archaeon]